MKGKKKTTDVDVIIGRRLRLTRIEKGMSQTELGNAAGIAFQQVQKYENGTNRIGVSRMVQFSIVLGLPISHFFQDVESVPPSMKQGL